MTAPRIPDEVAEALARGRAAYMRGDFAGAETADRDALAAADRLGSAEGAVRATRYLGLCAYRRGESAQSAALLEKAGADASAIGWVDEELLVHNHLGATYRKLGRLDDADRVLREGLLRADPRHHLRARARLLGNYGAFLDDLGDARAAAEHYARYEELLSLLDDPSRLANAHGLVSRAARMRGDLLTAEAKAREELRLGAEARHPMREGRGWMHLAQALAASGRNSEADTAFVQADLLLSAAGDKRAPIDIAHARGRFYLGLGRLQEAFEQVGRATGALATLGSTEHEHRAHMSGLAAEVASAAGLHGEALWHMADALECQLTRFSPIADPRLLPYTRGRRQALVDLARRLVREAGAVERGPDETRRVEDLLLRLSDDRPAPEPSHETVEAWRARIRFDARARWERLLGGVFPSLSETTRQELVLADVVSEGPVGDLSRSLLLLFTTVERELRDRVFMPLRALAPPARPSHLHRLLSERRPYGLGDMVNALLEPPSDHADTDARTILERRLPNPRRLASLRALREGAMCVDGSRLQPPLQWRNDVAHGRPWTATRIEGDAVRRALTVGPDAPLGAVLALTLR